MMEETPEKLDWVNRRADCELDAAFQKLAVDVEEDVGVFNSKFALESPQAIVFQKRAEYPMFSVYRRLPAGTLKVVFSLKLDRIEIEDDCGVQALSVIPFLADNGRCKFQVGGEEIEQWQLRRKVLEAIFYRPMPR
jgi:hypothetical protein